MTGHSRNFKRQTSNIKLAAVFIVFFQISCSDPSGVPSPSRQVVPPQVPPACIISLAPSITEILFSLGLGDRVAGVTRFCDYPPEALEKAEVGGYFDINYEAVLALEPDLAIHLSEHDDARTRLGNLGIPTLAVDHRRVEGILESISIIAGNCGAREKGENLRLSLENRIREVREGFLAKPSSRSVVHSKPRVLVAVGRSLQPEASGEILSLIHI